MNTDNKTALDIVFVGTLERLDQPVFALRQIDIPPHLTVAYAPRANNWIAVSGNNVYHLKVEYRTDKHPSEGIFSNWLLITSARCLRPLIVKREKRFSTRIYTEKPPQIS